MKINVPVIELKKALGVVLKGVSTRPHLPVLSGIFLKAEKGVVSLTTTDLEMSFWMEIPVKIEQEGEVVVPAKLFFDLVSTMGDFRVDIEVVEAKMKISAAGFEAEIVCQKAEEYPVVPKSSGNLITVDSEDFKRKIDKVIFSSAKDDTRPVLTGILFLIKSGTMSLVATDGFRLSLNNLQVKSYGEDISCIVPARSLYELQKVISDLGITDFGIEFDKNAKQVIFVFSGLEMSSRLLDGEFPPYQQIIPNTYSSKISLNKDELLAAVKRASLFAKDSANVIKVQVTDRIHVSAENSQVGSNTTTVEGEIEGEKITVAFNARYLQDCLSVVESDYVEWETEGELKPSVFRDSKSAEWLQVIMPIRVQG